MDEAGGLNDACGGALSVPVYPVLGGRSLMIGVGDSARSRILRGRSTRRREGGSIGMLQTLFPGDPGAEC